ncbi:hypothetical protein C8Q80DRAFT_1117257 [Daedaleopsis nitida]|nr:hypothetical protein C8Q80DRAFT_1117257 [Daedaleopsis nitida]
MSQQCHCNKETYFRWMPVNPDSHQEDESRSPTPPSTIGSSVASSVSGSSPAASSPAPSHPVAGPSRSRAVPSSPDPVLEAASGRAGALDITKSRSRQCKFPTCHASRIAGLCGRGQCAPHCAISGGCTKHPRVPDDVFDELVRTRSLPTAPATSSVPSGPSTREPEPTPTRLFSPDGFEVLANSVAAHLEGVRRKRTLETESDLDRAAKKARAVDGCQARSPCWARTHSGCSDCEFSDDDDSDIHIINAAIKASLADLQRSRYSPPPQFWEPITTASDFYMPLTAARNARRAGLSTALAGSSSSSLDDFSLPSLSRSTPSASSSGWSSSEPSNSTSEVVDLTLESDVEDAAPQTGKGKTPLRRWPGKGDTMSVHK